MNTILRKFVDEPLFDACAALLNHLHISFNEITRTPVPFEGLYPGALSKTLQEIMRKVEHTYFIGTVDEASLSGQAKVKSGEDVTQEAAQGRYAGMMVFAAEIRDRQKLTRTELATLTRGFNRIAAAQPVVLFIKQNDKLALATCERSEYTQQWRDGEKLGKVSLLRDINCKHPHRGHIDVLNSIGDRAYTSFDKLYEHWKDVFSSELLTQKFYSELQNWYFWAVKNVSFPNDIEDDTDDQKYNNENVIRLITRLMFVWFLKQKHLVNPDLFDEEKLHSILKDFDPLSEESNYYVGIIQNLFFATLNQEISKRKFIQPSRIIDKNYHNIKTYYRNQKLFIDENDEEKIISYFNQSPYVNGSLFECLDNKQYDGKTFYWDGFSQHKRFKNGSLKQAVVPNYLFFTEEEGVEVDMKDEYGKTSTYKVKVSGLLSILTKYQFTIEENTPLDEDVALDPELLGRAFENLLGAYNPETQKTARKNTGSYYTPRDIVNYMVRESLLSHLCSSCPTIPVSIINSLLDYHETGKPDGITDEQIQQIVDAVYHCRVLDPACGSGAFPMGVLQMLVHILRKLDENNKYWYKIVMNQAMEELKRIGSETEEERQRLSDEITRTFEEKVNDPDYTRKLYIIEKCIYGVDIQTVAVQISRLRCFISLLCEQPTNNDPEKNYGIKPLPNLETNFVAANTLLSLKLSKEEETLLRDDEVTPLISELREIRHLLFMPRDNQAKRRLKEKDEDVRQRIDEKIQEIYNRRLAEAIALQDTAIADINAKLSAMADDFDENQMEEVTEYDIFGNATKKKVKKANPKTVLLAKLKNAQDEKYRLENDNRLSYIIKKIRQLVSWDPFDQNISSLFFEPEWMFGVTSGFDVVIGNPPYIQLQAERGKLATLYEPCGFETFNRGGDIYCLFYERGHHLLKPKGTLCYITSNKWMRAGYGEELRMYLTQKTNPTRLIDFGETHVFESATVMTNILKFQRAHNEHQLVSTQIKEDFHAPSLLRDYVDSHNMICCFEDAESWVIMPDDMRALKKRIEAQGKPLEEWDIDIYRGVLTGFNKAFIIDTETRDKILANCQNEAERERTGKLIRPILRGKDVRKYSYNWAKWLIGTFPSRKFNIEDFPSVKSFMLTFTIEKLEQTGKTHNVNGQKIKSRKRTSGKWFETQDSIAYWNEFNKEKIIYPNMTKYLPFYYDEQKFFTNQKCFIITGKHMSYLTAFLNSSLFKFCFFDNFPVLFGGARELSKIFFDKIPVLEVDDATDAEFRELVLDIQQAYSDEKAKEIDQRIFDLYGLTQDEREKIGYIDFHGESDDEDDEEDE